MFKTITINRKGKEDIPKGAMPEGAIPEGTALEEF